jgi:hypothetical protein
MTKVLDQTIGRNFAVYNADCVDVLASLPDHSVDFSVFSPPFSSLYTYSNSERDMGNAANDDEFFDHFGFLAPELLRVTKPGRLVAFHCMNLPSSKERDGVIGLKDFRGDMIRIFKAAGWVYHSEVCIWKDPVTAMQRTKALGLLHKTIRKDSAMSRQGIADYVVVMRAPATPPMSSPSACGSSTPAPSGWTSTPVTPSSTAVCVSTTMSGISAPCSWKSLSAASGSGPTPATWY